MRKHSIIRWSGVAMAAALAASLAACAPTGNADGGDVTGASAEEIAAALQEESSITVWGWAPQLEPIVEAFEEKYPKIDVKLENVGTGNDHYTKLQNAIKAGTGAPDVAQVEYYALPQFALSGAFADLTGFGAGELEDQYTPSTWGSVSLNDGIYALPQDSGPMAMFYREDVFTNLGLEIPTTWDEYIAAGKAIHAANPDAYITNDTGDAGFTTSMIWQAGGNPYVVDGTTDVTVDFADEGSTKWADTWNQLVQEDLVAPISSWSDEWYQGLTDGSIATLVIGAWMPGNLESGVPDAAGTWRVAPMPTYEEGVAAAAENGGGGQSVVKQSKNPALAAAFLRWLNSDPASIEVFLESGGFPATTADLEDPDFVNLESEYFGGQKINEVLVQAAKDVVPGWSYLPFQTYANSIYGDTVGQAYASKSDLNEGLAAWQEATVKYGVEQGFTVNGE